MTKAMIILGLALLISGISSLGSSPCPIYSNIGSIVSARVTVAHQLSLVTLIQGTDSLCYNYSLPYTFNSVAQVAIGTYLCNTAVHDFQARASTDLFFSIKSIQTESLTSVPFIIRTHWKYTYWNKIIFSFIAEDRKDFESGYYQIDSGLLGGGCTSSKSIQVLLPFRSIGLQSGLINHNLFLHGFQISSQRYTADTLSPFELQIVQSTSNTSGIAVLISVTTVTQVQAIFISYIAWIKTDLSIIVGNYAYEPVLGSYEVAHTPLNAVSRNYARIYGVTGFIFNYNSQNISFATTWSGSRFLFDFGQSQTLLQYFSFQYIFFIGSECGSCPGYEFISNGICHKTCPAGSYPTSDKTCITCGEGYYWDGSSCIKLCPTGQNLNPYNNQCECPAGTNWTGSICISCTLGRIYNSINKVCECPSNTRWNGYSCVVAQNCVGGREWNVYNFACQCPSGTSWNGTSCSRIKICTGGSYLNIITNQCVCPSNTQVINGVCQSTGCNGGQTWNGISCQCDTGYNWNGTFCLICINGQVWNPIAKSCLCDTNYTWNGNFCERSSNCSGNRIYDRNYQVCLCPDGFYWNGNSCLAKASCCCGQTWNDTSFQCNCPTSFNWDGSNCVYCTNGKVWDSYSKTCVCQTGTQWNNQFCAVVQNCQGGTIWNQNTWACECPVTTVWSGAYCLANPCTGGQIWDNVTKICVCLGGKVLVNGYCVPPQQACSNGQVWDNRDMVCKCPSGQWFNGMKCVSISKCVSNQIYNPLNNQCVCPSGLVFLASQQICGDPTCPSNQRWNGQSCVDLTCPPGSWYNGKECVCPNPYDRCLPWELFDGYQCVYYQYSCPTGTSWNGKSCVPTTNDCPQGFYKDGTQCKPLPQRCLYPTVWQNDRCVSTNGSCPYGTVTSGNTCQPYSSCQNGQNWDSATLQCLCPRGTGWSGKECVVCAGGQVWDLYDGCTCPQGYFMAGSRCQKPASNMCKLIPNAYWDTVKQSCLCELGFSVVGYQCVCRGVAFERFCDRCAHRPHSEYYFGICKCNNGYTLVGSECLPNSNNGGNVISDCSVGTFFDTQQKKCLACPSGCLACSDCYTCTTCSPDFVFDPASSLCSEKCGDAKRYVRECDDGNTVSGDGCSASCLIESGYTCRGGSPSSPDNCMIYNPTQVSFGLLGQVRYSTKLVLTISLDYLPKELIQANQCNDACSSVLIVNITEGDKPISIKSSFVSGSRYSFSVQLQFGKMYISSLKISIQVNPSLARYFQSVLITNSFAINVNPAQLSSASINKDVLASIQSKDQLN